jgi:hypothetical protein
MCTFHLSVGFSLCGVVVQADFVSAVYMGIPASASTGFRLSHTLQCQPMTMCVCVWMLLGVSSTFCHKACVYVVRCASMHTCVILCWTCLGPACNLPSKGGMQWMVNWTYWGRTCHTLTGGEIVTRMQHCGTEGVCVDSIAPGALC